MKVEILANVGGTWVTVGLALKIDRWIYLIIRSAIQCVIVTLVI
jgi:hypothetical protein